MGDNAGTANPPGLDLRRLEDHLAAHLPGVVQGELKGEVIAGGRSNLTYAVTDGRTRWVVRRPPLGHVLPTAHDMAREHRVVSALAGTAVPVPGTLLLCTDPDVIGAPFYVMEYVEGVPYRTARQLAAIGPERTHAVAMTMIDTLVALHAVDPAGVGLADFGRPEGFLERQVRRWSQQLEASRSRELPGIDELRSRLAENIPEGTAPAIVHGDYRLDNLLVGPDDRVRAVIDWEMSTLGDPLTDLALILTYNSEAMRASTGVSDAHTAEGYPDADEIIARYAAGSGRDITHLDWYVGLAFFKLAVILEGIHYRYRQGKTVGADFDRIGEVVPRLVEGGLKYLTGD
ncbi:phosphotransferase family protein [Streptomonospora nanhaiensis]|uniref:Aminoglycoside phosphotransferase (APT) family kinase protein n=1 Tax=Streptomonospora nanhaiensis TaxID=1323731 RepID=A0A853BF99_9ACTN|nr:phosphotransferase family protein [Streptomonospora nanhaiensis]MBV2363741.1 phosphotransferase family protein [Streptomonospora nanhaiensis]MBX9387813.1 phosphotransferase family protein [Streptomonospora nanhaiensis]NYI93959.1 aminoglycoside phosphotransferase (APT) family kinase protein [Streptomonospora nanhaiensis]